MRLWNKLNFSIDQFGKLLAAQFISKVGTYAHEVVFTLLVFHLSNGNYFQMGLVYFFRLITFIILGPLGGIVAGAYNKKNIMLAIDLIRFMLSSISAYLMFNNAMSIYLLGVIGSLFTVFRAFYQPAFQAITPELLGEKRILKGYSWLRISDRIATVVGPLVSTLILLTLKNNSFILVFDASTFLLSAIITGSLHLTTTRHYKINGIKSAYSLLWEKVILLKKSKLLFNVMICSSTCLFFTSGIIKFILPHQIFVLSGHNQSWVSASSTIIALGSVFAGLIFSKLSHTVVVTKVLNYWITYGVILILVTLSTNYVYSIIGLMVILGALNIIIDISITSSVYKYSQQEDVAFNLSILSTFLNLAESCSGLSSGIISSMSPQILIIVMAGLTITLPLFILKRSKQVLFPIK